MINSEFKLANDVGSGGGQDVFALEVLGTGPQTYVDIGCRQPVMHNNSFLMHQLGWSGICLDIIDFEEMYRSQRPGCEFYQADCIRFDFLDCFKENFKTKVIDYLSLDVEGNGDRFEVLKNVMSTGYNFRVITVEHDNNCGYTETEMIPQRKLLRSLGYELVVECDIIEDFWVHPDFVKKEKYEKFFKKWRWPDDNKDFFNYRWYKEIGFDYERYYRWHPDFWK